MEETIENLKTIRQIRGQLLASWNLNHDKFTNVCAAEPTEINAIVSQAHAVREGLHALLTIAELIVVADQLIEAAEEEIYHSAGCCLTLVPGQWIVSVACEALPIVFRWGFFL